MGILCPLRITQSWSGWSGQGLLRFLHLEAFVEIPPPSFRTSECYAQCCVCSSACVLYWVRDDVWEQLKSAAQCCGGHLCVGCAETFLKRPLTLEDLAIEKYLHTARNESAGSPPVVIHCVVDTVMGAASHAGVATPLKWCYMWNEYFDLGKKLASRTPNAGQVVARLIVEAEEHFPNFSNPYSAD
jgi:hypothetical protein